eukprot:Skav224618  [mRNA]  locus=scaffold2059:43867:47460:- [translate_table: standard]
MARAALLSVAMALLSGAVDVVHTDDPPLRPLPQLVEVKPSAELEAQPGMMRKQVPSWQAPVLSSLKEQTLDCLELTASRVANVCPSEMTGEEFCKSRFYVDLHGNIRPCNWFTIANNNPPNCDWDGKLSCTPTSAAEIRARLNITRT